MNDPRLKPFDGERAQRILDTANTIIATIPQSAELVECSRSWCDGKSRFLYGEGICPVCYWEDEGIIPLRHETIQRALLMAKPLFEAPV